MELTELDLLIEAEQMRVILSSVKQLSAQSDGVMIDGKVVPWDEALPLMSAYPDFNATEQKKAEWMGLAAVAWQEDYHAKVTEITSRAISENSTLENDNLYFWSLLNVTTHTLSKLLRFVNRKAIEEKAPNILSVSNDLLVALNSVTKGTQSTSRIRDEIFLSGMENVWMEFHMLYLKAKEEGREEDSAIYVDTLSIIKQVKSDFINQPKSHS
ncbi:hypothetical protein ACLI07_23775 (plasmid) [Providencia huaxiensis]|uniref:Uncharacterized protein n=5 Tax=Enterobacterales TaxID=91347 RepID=Q8KK44_PROVU|nr:MULTISPECIES: hypothetical protein [Enterobacterales]ELB1214743.1 hypothetical protein [Proteus mirabilis]ELY4881568.1 hypothetical protein [Morganella morganii]SPY66437.1 Uncharacterised protein [Providencia stuartii]HAZ7869392.1 hypothetical protein [Escherichia coli]ELR5094370.1 hypothetical protein [Providencia rettgeri]